MKKLKNFDIELVSKYAQCDVCHKVGGVLKFKYVTRNYQSKKRPGHICTKLQTHHHELWICADCLDELDAVLEEKKRKIMDWKKEMGR